MTKNLKIEDTTARKLYLTANLELKAILEESFGKEFFSLSIINRIKNIDDILEIVGKTMEEVIPYRNPKTKEQKSTNAQMLIFEIVKVYNEGKILNWKDANEYKYYPYKYFSDGSWTVAYDNVSNGMYCPLGLYFKESKLALDAIDKFSDIYNDFFMI